jgi:hypothetical protein
MPTSQYSQQFTLELFTKEHDVENDTLKAILMTTGFTFDPETDSTYADVSASEIANGNGYTTGGQALTSVAASLAGGVVTIDCDDPTWTASGGAIADCVAMLVYNDSHASKTVVCCLEYGVTYGTATGTNHIVDCSNGLIKGTPNPT